MPVVISWRNSFW